MKFRLLLISLFVTVCMLGQKKPEKSGSFETPGDKTKLLQLKNGNTMLIELAGNDGIKALVFDTLRKKCGSAKVTGKLLPGKLKYALFIEAFESGDDVAVFITAGEDRVPALYRLLLDGKTGKLKAEEELCKMDKIKLSAGYAVMVGGVDMPRFEAINDEESGYYAVLKYNSFAEETKDRIEVLHYNPSHKLLTKANYTSPFNAKYTRLLAGFVKPEYVVIATYDFNTTSSGGEEAKFYISQLRAGKSDFKHHALSYDNFYKRPIADFIYNKKAEILTMALVNDIHYKKGDLALEYHFHNIDPKSLKVEKEFIPNFDQVNNYYQDKMGSKDAFSGILRDMKIDKNGNLVMFFQQKTEQTTKYGVKLFWGDAALLTVTPAGKTIGAAVFPASIYHWDQAFDMQLLTTANGSYILFNNTIDNMKLGETEAPKMIKARGVMVPVKYTYTGSSVKREFVFKEPKEKKGNPFCLFGVCDYNEKTQKLATLYFEPEKNKTSIVYIAVQ